VSENTDPLRQFVFDNHLHTDLPTDQKRILVEQACSELGKHPSTVRRAIAKVKAEGSTSRRVRSDKGAFRVFSDEAFAYLKMLVENRHHMSGALIYRSLRDMYPDESFCDDTVRAAIKSIEREIQAAKVKHLPQRRTFEHVNDRWEVDGSRSDFFIADPRHNDGVPTRVPLIAVIDCYSRSILWACYSFNEDSVLVGQLLYNAVRPKADHSTWPMHGIPLELGCDNGKVFKSEHARDMVRSLNIAADYSRPHVPQDKPYIERVFGTIHRQFEDTLPGSCGPDNKGDEAVSAATFREVGGCYYDRKPPGANREPARLLTLDEANQRLWRYIAEEYHQNTHSGIGCPPVLAWVGDVWNVAGRLDYNDALLSKVCFSRPTTRHVRNGEVRLNGFTYGHNRLLGYHGMEVSVRWLPGDCRFVRAYDDHGALICEAVAEGATFIHDDVCSVREQRKGRLANVRRVRQQREAVANARADELPDLEKRISDRKAAVYSLAPQGNQVPLSLANLTPDQRAAIPESIRDKGLPTWAAEYLKGLSPEQIAQADFEELQQDGFLFDLSDEDDRAAHAKEPASEGDDLDVSPMADSAPEAPGRRPEPDPSDVDFDWDWAPSAGQATPPAGHLRAGVDEAEAVTPRAAGGGK